MEPPVAIQPARSTSSFAPRRHLMRSVVGPRTATRSTRGVLSMFVLLQDRKTGIGAIPLSDDGGAVAGGPPHNGLSSPRREVAAHDREGLDFHQRLELRRDGVKVGWQMVISIYPDDEFSDLVQLSHPSLPAAPLKYT